MHGDAHHVHVLLGDGGGDGLRRLPEAGEHDLEPVVTENAGDDAQSPVVAVQADLGQKDPEGVAAGGSHQATERSTQVPNTDSRACIASPTVT